MSAGAGGGAGEAGAAAGGAAGEAGGGASGAGASGGESGAAGQGTGGGGSGTAGSAGTSGASGASGSGIAPGCDPPGMVGVPASGICGDGIVSGSEECDDGNDALGDGCVGCKLVCPIGAIVSSNNRCYFVNGAADFNKQAASEVYLAPPAPEDGTGGYIRANWGSEYCSTKSGVATHLAQFETEADWAAFRGNLVAGAGALGEELWVAVGARWTNTVALEKPASWFNSEGGNPPSSMWRTGFPAAEVEGVPSHALCGALGTDGYLGNVACFPAGATPVKRHSLCERERACALIDVNGKLDDQVGYQGTNGHCYARLDPIKFAPMKWEEAAKACERFGAHLVRFEVPGEYAAMPGAGLTRGEVWVGAERKACANDEFVWAGTNILVPKTNTPGDQGLWGGVEPNNAGGSEKCAVLDERRKMGDLPCDYQKGAFCERDY